VHDIITVILAYDGFRWASALMYAVFATGLLWLGFVHHQAKVRGDKEVKQYPRGYFTFLSIQLIPLLVTGFVIGDAFVIGTRLWTLVAVAIVYMMTSSEDGTFVSARHLAWSFVMIALAMLVPMLWSESETAHALLRDFQPYIAWGSVAVMILFVWKGQLSVARELFSHFVGGNYSVKRLNLQFVRLAGFALQSLAYWYAPSKATPIFGFDPIFVQGAIGTLGVAFVLASALVGFVGGSRRRRYNKAAESTLALVRTA